MKTTILIMSLFVLSLDAFCQSDTTQNKATMSKKIPPLNMLPKNPGEVKHIYELPGVYEYKVYDGNGNLIEQKKGEFIDYTLYKKGTYFIKYDNKTETFKHE